MELRTKLLVSFTSVVLLVLAVFGYIAYHIAIDSVYEAELYHLDKHIDENISNIPLTKKSAAPNTIKRLLKNIDNNTDYHFIVIGKNKKIIINTAGSSTSSILDKLNLKEFSTVKNDSKIILKDKNILLKSRLINNGNYKLIAFSKSNHDAIAPISDLATRLFIAVIIILWVAIWVALIISTAITRRLRKQTEALEHQSLHNELTNLPNRTKLLREIDKAIDAARISKKHAALVILDLDNFKDINDTLGHRVGDFLVTEIGKRLSAELWDRDIIAHMGGDSFAVLLTIQDISHCAIVTNKLLDIIASTYTIEGMTINVEASMGIASYPQHGHDASTIYRCAEIAMYHAKENDEDYSFYDSAKDPFNLKRLKLMGDLKYAAERNELELYYQPKVNLSNGDVLGVEALIRWHHPQHGMIPPDEFIPLSEQTGIIKTITEWVISTAVSHCKEWQDLGQNMSVAINLSPRVLHDIQLPTKVATILQESGLAPESLTLEITETAVMTDPVRALDVLSRLHSMGIKLSIDDFGTGYTSMSYLRQLPIDEIKIDKSFVLDLLKNHNDVVIVQSIIDLARNMGLQVVAEGIEDDETYRELINHKCDFAQGYYISRPLPLKELYLWVGNKNHNYKKSCIGVSGSVSKFKKSHTK